MQLNVAEDSPARQYEVGVRYNGIFEDDPAFYLFATAGVYHEEDILELDPESTNWIGFVGIGPKRGGKRDIAIAFRGTQVSGGVEACCALAEPPRPMQPRLGPYCGKRCLHHYLLHLWIVKLALSFSLV